MPKDLILAFTAVFVSINILGITPIFLSITSDVEHEERSAIIRNSIFTAFVVATIFVFAGNSILKFLGITPDDLRVGGGILLFLIAITDILYSSPEKRRKTSNEIAIVPIGIPLVLGPAAMTTIILSSGQYGYLYTFIGVVINFSITFVIFTYSKFLAKVLGEGGMKAMAKISSLFLLAIAVMMIRIGIKHFINGNA